MLDLAKKKKKGIQTINTEIKKKKEKRTKAALKHVVLKTFHK